MKLVISCFVAIGCSIAAPPSFPMNDEVETNDDHPFFALWRMDHGLGGGSPSVRFAIWNDGRVAFAKDAKKWGSERLRGRIASYRVDRLKQALSESGVFSLKGNCYLVPDGGVDCLIVDVGGKKQMLYWDEVESANYGININPKPHHLEFMRCWKWLNSLGLVACPDQCEPSPERIELARSWYFKEAIQSE